MLCFWGIHVIGFQCVSNKAPQVMLYYSSFFQNWCELTESIEVTACQKLTHGELDEATDVGWKFPTSLHL
jgi:hypothetical protein